MATFESLINRTIRRLAMVGGTGTQLYSEDLIADMLQHTFDVVFEEVDWPQYTFWDIYALDGTLGVVTSDLSELVKDYEHIIAIYPENATTQLTKLSSTTNPFELSGNTPMHYSPYNASDVKVFHVWPKTSTGNIVVHAKTKPDAFTATSNVKFDDQCLITGACYDFLADDGSNPGAEEKFRNLFESRLKSLKNRYNNAPISLDPVTDRTQTFTFTELP